MPNKLQQPEEEPEAARGPEAVPKMGPRPAVLLVRPQLGVNIGIAMRAMANFGLDELRLVAPLEGWPNPYADAAAAKAEGRVTISADYPDLPAAIGEFNWVCATTARQRDLTIPIYTPEQMVREMARRIDAGERCAVMFGPEKCGLTNDDIAVADAAVMILVRPDFASLNLGQAVLLIAYEWMRLTGEGTLGRVSTCEKPRNTGFQSTTSRPATREELLMFFDHLEKELDGKGFLFPLEKRPSMVRKIRMMFSRMGATEAEVRILRGIVAALAQGCRRRAESEES